MKIVAADDAMVDREILKRMILRILAQTDIDVDYQECHNAEELYKIDLEDCDLLLMDIYFGEANGMELVKKIRMKNRKLPIVFVTASPDYVLESYDVYAYYYLMKPLSYTKVENLISRFLREKFGYKGEKCFIRKDSRGVIKYRIPYNDITYVESFNTQIDMHVKDGDETRLYGSLTKLENELPKSYFYRCHQSYIVNYRYVKKLEASEFIMNDGKRIPIRKKGIKNAKDRYNQYLLEMKYKEVEYKKIYEEDNI